MADEDNEQWINHYYHCNTQWDDVWSFQCDDECPVCRRDIQPYASTEAETGDMVIHNTNVHIMAEDEEPCCRTCGDAECTEHL